MIRDRVFTILFYTFFVITSIVLFIGSLIIWLLTILFDKKLALLHIYTQYWSALYLWASPFWRTKVIGRKKIKRNTAYVLVSNHQSQLDILVAMTLFRHFKWVSKTEVFRVPVVGWNMKLNKYIQLVRGDKKSIIKMMKDCDIALENGSSVFLFPEGTRSENGILRKFKPGAFTIAKRNKVPIVPIAISGTVRGMHKKSANLYSRGNFRIEVLDEIPYESFAEKEDEDIAGEVRDIIGKHVEEHVEV